MPCSICKASFELIRIACPIPWPCCAPPLKCLQDQQIECSLEKLDTVWRSVTFRHSSRLPRVVCLPVLRPKAGLSDFQMSRPTAPVPVTINTSDSRMRQCSKDMNPKDKVRDRRGFLKG